ncbi:glycosyltransferase [Ornithinibacillus sp. L9]|uniref:Glycosyltransferase n=1 Tax=Ornithinibacillus caprae TaxID=2678566 RepID=A0A6N8FJ98_9BACI|nr:glycosyltransferase [Ornithinibacillus caprae]MUK87418.1 glycosyltransferase [Ornithinibacillus caprae]
MYNFCFVILHYNVLQDTIECVDSIIKIARDKKIEIVVVDNNSPNKSGRELKTIYKEYKNVHIIVNAENLGFAKGNNIGYDFAKNQLKADFVAIINNDTMMIDEYFVDKIMTLFLEEEFHIMGPDIITKNGEHQNPYKEKAVSLEEVEKFLKNYKMIKKISKVKIMIKRILFKSKFLINLIKSIKKDKNKIFDYKISYHNVVLHGSAIVYSPLYIKNEKYAFHPDTFMYVEEDILYHLCLMKNYIIKYNPITKIYHKEDSATDSLLNSDEKKQEFILENHKTSYKVLRDLLKNSKNEG